ncbi:MAG: citramalate synthase [Rhodobacteraceae bacterium]|nr:citramalate synthase [Paracoccaceae bacterium]
MNKERLYIYDTTLRDGAQTLGVQFGVTEKRALSDLLDDLKVDYIEGGFPGANDTDEEFFSSLPVTRHAKMTAFGMTKRVGRSAANDPVLSQVLAANTPSVCLVGKAHDFHVREALQVTLEENLESIGDSIARVVAAGREAIFDAEHFFDGYRDNPEYALACVHAAYAQGARWIVLCDTNGGTLPGEIEASTRAVIDSGIPGADVGIHTHNDTENAVAGSLAAVDAGARQVQGTLNGLGERCGNANLITLMATLALKEPYRSRFVLQSSSSDISKLTSASRMLDEILDRRPNKHAAYVGDSAFAHKGGLHASAVNRNAATYEHVEPERVGNSRNIPVSNQAGRASIDPWFARLGIEDDSIHQNCKRDILAEVKRREKLGYTYDVAQASFILLVKRMTGKLPEYFSIKRYRVIVERDGSLTSGPVTSSEAVVVMTIGDDRMLSASEGLNDGRDSGPVHAISKALKRDLGPYQKYIDDMNLIDFKVRIYGTGTEAVTRVIIDCADSSGTQWSTVGVSPNIIDASFEALVDAIVWKLNREGAVPVKGLSEAAPQDAS